MGTQANMLMDITHLKYESVNKGHVIYTLCLPYQPNEAGLSYEMVRGLGFVYVPVYVCDRPLTMNYAIIIHGCIYRGDAL